ncbi:MAG TPA: hypothetical protein ENN56_01780, partial [Firmicutes bacterium]|nr:hypothetical protein [Bacillota bacterium]
MRGRKNDGVSGLFAWILIAGTFIIGAIGCAESDTRESADTNLQGDLIGTWFAYRDNVIENMWTFKRDGTVSNDGWPGMPSATEPALPPYH